MPGLDRRSTSDVGRQACLRLGFEVRGPRTVLSSSYAEPPFRAPRGFAEPGGALHAILASSGPGIFGGDRFRQTVDVAAGARVRLTSQSAQQVHPSRGSATARVDACYHVAQGGHLHCAWDPSILFGGARLDQRIRIDLAEGASLFWSDALMAGREARGERWAFERLTHELRLVRNGELVYLERYAIDRNDVSVTRRWIAAGACYFGGAVVVGPAALASAEALHGELASSPHLQATVDRVDDDVLVARVMSSSGPPFHHARARLARIDGCEAACLPASPCSQLGFA